MLKPKTYLAALKRPDRLSSEALRENYLRAPITPGLLKMAESGVEEVARRREALGHFPMDPVSVECLDYAAGFLDQVVQQLRDQLRR